METNWIAIIVSALVTFVVGFIWYNPKVFGTAWMNAVGMTEEKIEKGNMPLIFGLSLLLAIVAAFNISIITGFHEGAEVNFGHGAFHGALVALFIGAPIIITNALYEQKSFVYMLINLGYWLINFSIMGGILMVWR